MRRSVEDIGALVKENVRVETQWVTRVSSPFRLSFMKRTDATLSARSEIALTRTVAIPKRPCTTCGLSGLEPRYQAAKRACSPCPESSEMVRKLVSASG